MKIDDAVEGLVLLLLRDPVPDRPEVVAQVRLARGLDAAEDALLPRISKVLVQGYSPGIRPLPA